MDAGLQARAEQLAGELASQAKTTEDINVLLRLMMKSALERMLGTELDVHLGRKGLLAAEPALARGPAPTEPTEPTEAPARQKLNRRNGHSRKTVQGDL